MEKTRFGKFILNMLLSFIHFFILIFLIVIAIRGSIFWLTTFLISALVLLASYVLFLRGDKGLALKLLLAMAILNFPIGMLSGISYGLTRKWVREEKRPLKGDEKFFDRWD